MLGHASHLERVSRWLARRDEELPVRLARELVSNCRTLNRVIAELDQELEQRVQLARHGGVAPLEASSGRTQRHRLDRRGNRHLNAALYQIAITQARYHPGARDYLERKQTEGKSRREAIRCLKRLLIRTVFNTLKANPTLT